MRTTSSATLARRGFAIPRDLLDRDVTVEHEGHPAVEAAWVEIYRENTPGNHLWALGEALTELADGFADWRWQHLKAGASGPWARRPAAAARPGRTWLRRSMSRVVFPEIWSAEDPRLSRSGTTMFTEADAPRTRWPTPGHRDLFHIPPAEGGRYAETAYLAGNSLGLQPRATEGDLLDDLDAWARLGVEGHPRRGPPMAALPRVPDRLPRPGWSARCRRRPW